MSFKISAFQEALSHQGARPNLFDMQLTLPTSGPTGLSNLNFNKLCKTAQIPGSTIGVVEVQYFGRPVKMPGNRTFENLTTTIINDEDFVLRNSMEAWMHFLNKHENNTSGVIGLNYTGTLTLQQYDKAGAAIDDAKYTFEKAWPVNVAPIDLDWGTNDTIEEFTVEWAYDWWANEKSASK